MPRPDALPSPRHSMLWRFRRVMKWMALLAIAAAAIAVLLAMRGSDGATVRILIATALGVGITALLGAGFMSLALLGSSKGHDVHAGRIQKDKSQ